MSWLSPLGVTIPPPREPLRTGDYLTDGTSLFCVEEVFDDHALLEDCRTLVLIDLDLRKLRALERVRASSPDRERRTGATPERAPEEALRRRGPAGR